MIVRRIQLPSLILLVCMAASSGSACAQGISKTAADAILDRYLQGSRLETAEARRELESAVDSYRRSSDASGLAKGLVLLGMSHDSAGRHPEAMAAYEEARKALDAVGDRFGAAIVELHMGDAETQARRFPAAKDHFDKALRLTTELEASGGTLASEMLVFFLRFMGLPAELFRGGQAGIGSFVDQIRPLFLPLVELDIGLRLSETHLALGDCASARSLLEQTGKRVENLRLHQVGWLVAQVFQQQMGSARKQLETTCGAAATPAPERYPTSAVAELQELDAQSDEARRKGDLNEEAELLARRASVLQYWGDFEGAAAALEDSLALFRRLPDRLRRARAEDALGVHLLLWNRYEDGLRHLEQALALYQRLGSELDEAVTLTYLGSASAILGLHGTALEQLGEARRLAVKHHSAAIESEAIYALAETRWMLGEDREALALLLQYLPMAARAGGPLGEARAHAVVAALLARLREDDEAERHATEALALSEGMGIVYLEASARVSLAQVLRRRGHTEEAFQHLDRAREIHRANGLRYLEAASTALKGFWLHQQGKKEEGLDEYRKGIALYETIQSTLRVPELLSGLNDQGGYQLYDRFLQLLVAEGRAEEAFEASERARARALLNLLGNRRLGRPGDSRRPVVAAAEELRLRLRSLEAQLQAPANQVMKDEARLKELARVRDDYSQALVRLKLTDPEYAGLVQVKPLALTDLRQKVLPSDTTLVAFFVTHERTFAWVIDRTTVDLVQIPCGRPELRRRVEELRQRLAPASPSGLPARGASVRISEVESIRAPSADLYHLLIAPLKPYLRQQRLLIVPHDALHYLPFAALWNQEGNRYLLQEHPLTFAPSASVLPHLQAKRTPNQGRALVMGDPYLGDLAASLPPLGAARNEAEGIARLLRTQPVLGDKATESLIDERAGQLDLLHLAAHGVYNAASPSFSRIELADDPANGDDGHLEVHELMSRVDLTGMDLVVLSACDSALGERSNGDEVVGLTRAFLYAGSPAVVATLWKVNDEATEFLLTSFYRRLGQGTSMAEALQAAQQDVARQKRWRSPYFWAAFVPIGDGGTV